jgi:hypothetical protein
MNWCEYETEWVIPPIHSLHEADKTLKFKNDLSCAPSTKSGENGLHKSLLRVTLIWLMRYLIGPLCIKDHFNS